MNSEIYSLLKPLCLTSIFVVTLFYAGCVNSSRVAVPESNQPDGAIVVDETTAGSMELADYLRRVPGVQIVGSGENMQVRIRGVSSYHMGTSPLYVINSQIIGTDYEQVDNMINMRNVRDIRVLKDSDASIYGIRGANGVIVITTRD